MFRRQLMSVLFVFASHHLVDSSALDSSKPKIVPLPRPVAQELLLLSIFAPLMCSDLTATLGDRVFCTNSSDAKGAVVSTPVPIELSRYFWRVGSKKGGHARLMTKQEALVHRLSSAGHHVDDSHHFDALSGSSPKKSPLLRFDFIEICGGAAKVSRELSKLGWVVGPCLDLDSSVHYDLSSVNLIRCQTRGYCPTEPRTLLGTTLALHGFSLMLVACRVGAIGLLEQSRRSKMCWMPEWRRFVENGWAHDEEWCASCAYGSKHKKEFRFLITNLESAELHRKCDGSHRHIKIDGKYTKPSAVYTDGLAQALANCISKGLRLKKAMEAYHHTKDSGLESVAFNDLLVASD